MYRSRNVMSDNMTGEVCVRNSRSCLRNKVSCIFSGETLTIRYDVICTVVLVADVNRQLICLLSPVCHHRSPRYTPTPWLTLLLVLAKCHVKQNLC